jgi:hypothetical protein
MGGVHCNCLINNDKCKTMGEGKYQPTEEEIQKADNIITPAQQKASSDRLDLKAQEAQDNYDHVRQEQGITWMNRDKNNLWIARGIIKGHEIRVEYEPEKDRYLAWVDEVPIHNDDPTDTTASALCKNLFDKYYPIAYMSDRASYDTNEAEREINEARKELRNEANAIARREETEREAIHAEEKKKKQEEIRMKTAINVAKSFLSGNQ